MNLQVQFLKKQVERQQEQIALLVGAFNAAVDESELRASVACAFAWDLASTDSVFRGDSPHYGERNGREALLSDMQCMWDEAAKAVGG